ncbi:MAG: hypothetical protein IT204_07180 [Fimbriimonadaceae bacterium]|nr:hypothetical protein [Fimbriimonadaceae bacterium]
MDPDAAAQALFDREWPRLKGTAEARIRSLTRSGQLSVEDREDLLQEARKALYVYLRRLTGVVPCDPAVRLRKELQDWLRGTVAKLVCTHFRQQSRRGEPHRVAAPADDLAAEGEALEALFGDGGAAALAAHDAGCAARFQADAIAALGELTALQREALVLRWKQELTEDGMVAVLRVPVGTVKSRLHSARQALARGLRERGWELPDV